MHRRVARDMRQLVEDGPILLGALLAFLAQPLGEYMGDFANGVEVVESWCQALDEMFARVPNDLRAFLKTYVTIGCSIVDGTIEGERLSPIARDTKPSPN